MCIYVCFVFCYAGIIFVCPPSASITLPIIKDDSSLAKNKNYMFAISCVVPFVLMRLIWPDFHRTLPLFHHLYKLTRFIKTFRGLMVHQCCLVQLHYNIYLMNSESIEYANFFLTCGCFKAYCKRTNINSMTHVHQIYFHFRCNLGFTFSFC